MSGGTIFWLLLLLTVAIGFFIAFLDEKRRHKIHLDLFQLPSPVEEKVFLKLIPLERRTELPVADITKEDLTIYKTNGFSHLEKKGKGYFLNLTVVLWPKILLPENEFKYLKNVIARHNWDYIKAMKASSETGLDISIPDKHPTVLTHLGKRFFEAGEEILRILDPAQIYDSNGFLLLTSKKILFDTTGFPGKKGEGLYFVTDYAHIVSIETAYRGGSTSTWHLVTIKTDTGTFEISSGRGVDMQAQVKEIDTLVNEKKGNRDYLCSRDFDDVGVVKLKESK